MLEETFDKLSEAAQQLPCDRRPTRPYTEEELAYALYLHEDKGVLLKDIAAILGRPESSLCSRLKERYGDEYSGALDYSSEAVIARLKERPAHSSDTEAKISATLTGQPNGWLGRAHSPETIEKIRAAKQDIPSKVREKMGVAHRGKKHSDEHKAKISEGLLGRQVSNETRAKIAAAHAGRTFSEDRVAAMRLTAVNRKVVITPDGRFASVSLAAEHHGIMRKTLTRWIESGKEGWMYEQGNS